jgi:subfamily B ATP-binding cassette protein MsbA
MQFYLRAISYFRDDLGKIILALIIIAIMTLSGLLVVYPLSILVDSVFGPHGPTNAVSRFFFHFAPEGKVEQVMVLAVFALVLRFAQELLSMAHTLLNIQIGYSGLMRVRCDLFRKLQALSLAYHRSQPQGDAIYRLSYDTFGFQTILNTLVQTILVSSITLIFMTALMLSMNWQLTLLSLSIAPLLFWTTKIYSRILTKKATEAKEVDTQLTTTIQRSAATIGLVQAFNREADEFGRFQSTVRDTIEVLVDRSGVRVGLPPAALAGDDLLAFCRQHLRHWWGAHLRLRRLLGLSRPVRAELGR